MLTRIETSYTSVSWIPSEAMTGPMRLPMDIGIGHYDQPPPDRIDDLEPFVADGHCRFANHLRAWADVEDGQIIASGFAGGGMVAPTEVNLKAVVLRVPAIAFPEIRTEESSDESVTLVQTAGGRTGAPLPRRAGKIGLPRLRSPTAWTTLAVTINADGTSSAEVRGASPFPRHWFYDDQLTLTAKSATIDFTDWTSGLHDRDTPWGENDRAVVAAEAESALERTLSTTVMQGDGGAPKIHDVAATEVIMAQGERAESMGVILDGLVEVDVDGKIVAECGPGCVVGERAFLEGGRRTATVRAATPVKLAIATPETFSPEDLTELRLLHQRELDGQGELDQTDPAT